MRCSTVRGRPLLPSECGVVWVRRAQGIESIAPCARRGLPALAPGVSRSALGPLSHAYSSQAAVPAQSEPRRDIQAKRQKSHDSLINSTPVVVPMQPAEVDALADLSLVRSTVSSQTRSLPGIGDIDVLPCGPDQQGDPMMETTPAAAYHLSQPDHILADHMHLHPCLDSAHEEYASAFDLPMSDSIATADMPSSSTSSEYLSLDGSAAVCAQRSHFAHDKVDPCCCSLSSISDGDFAEGLGSTYSSDGCTEYPDNLLADEQTDDMNWLLSPGLLV